MSARATAVVALLVSGLSFAIAQPRPDIPANQLPGHERERFIDPYPQPPSAGPVIVVPKHGTPKRDCGPRRSKRSRKKC